MPHGFVLSKSHAWSSMLFVNVQNTDFMRCCVGPRSTHGFFRTHEVQIGIFLLTTNINFFCSISFAALNGMVLYMYYAKFLGVDEVIVAFCVFKWKVLSSTHRITSASGSLWARAFSHRMHCFWYLARTWTAFGWTSCCDQYKQVCTGNYLLLY